jgi:hypothetical protein
MKTPADIATENAISFEVKKDGLQQRQNGDWMLRLIAQAKDLQPTDIHQVIVNANMGTRFLCTLVQIDDNEMPVDHKAMDRDKWRALGPAKQAGIRCKDPVFQAYLREVIGFEVYNEEDAASVVRTHCNVLTRGDLGKPGFSDQRILWFDLDNKFQAWKAKENA